MPKKPTKHASKRPPRRRASDDDDTAGADDDEIDEGYAEVADDATTIAFPGGENDDDDDEKEGGGHKKSKVGKTGGFQSMGLSPGVYKSVMRKGYRVPTPIQRKAIPAIMSGRDIVAMARTGSGKTAAFLLPLLERLGGHSQTVGVRGLVLSPTRELAVQTHTFCLELSHFVDPPLRFALLVGGDAVEEQFDTLARNPDVVVGTPGRLQHVLVDAQFSLARVEYVVCDEADRLFEMGFAQQLDAILESIPEARQTCLFSATMPAILADFTRARLHEPQLIRLDLDTKLSDALEVHFVRVRPQEKLGALLVVLSQLIKKDEQTIVFVSTRHHVEMVYELLVAASFDAAAIYGSLDPTARKIALGRFRAGKAKVLVVTDVAARGIDVPLLDNVLNFDFPTKPKLFVHRAGRAARAGRAGRAISLVEPEELPYLVDLHLYLGRTLRPVPIGGMGASADGAGAGGAAAAGLGLNEVALAVLPPSALETEIEYVTRQLAANPELANLHGVAMRSLQMVRKTRPAASKASVSRARELPKELGIHPLCADRVDIRAEAARSHFLTDLKTFKPAASSTAVGIGAPNLHGLFGQKAAVSARKRDAALAPHHANAATHARTAADDDEDDVAEVSIARMFADDDEVGGERASAAAPTKLTKKARKRAAAAAAVAAHADDGDEEDERAAPRGKRKRVDPSDFRDASFFMEHERPVAAEDAAAAASDRFLRVNAGEKGFGIDDAVMDLAADERDTERKRRSVLKWDHKRRKYVRETLGQFGTTELAKEPGKKRQRDESGNLIQEKANLYEAWQKSSKRRIQAPGEREGPDAGDAGPARKKFSKSGKRWHTATKPLPNSNVKSELKSDEQITKARKTAATKAGKGKGGGGKGGGGKSGDGKGGGGKGGGGKNVGGPGDHRKGRGGGGKGGGRGGGKGGGRGGGISKSKSKAGGGGKKAGPTFGKKR